jgi:enamine deaminase RidA (YjgF/YER057c/UK114 family)
LADPSLLGGLAFSHESPPLKASFLHIPAASNDASLELWVGSAPVIAGASGDIRFRHDGEYLFGILQVDEPVEASTSPLQQTTESAYRQIFALMASLGYPVSLRFWNYIAGINKVTHGLERYRQFNLGRQEAYLASGREVKDDLPAACALGIDQGPLSIAFLAGRTPGLPIEIPRQISAYDYPQDYGPRSPTFSRAYLLPQAGLLLISGTASIIGHQTVHIGDVKAQTRETLTNLQAVIAAANRHLPGFEPKHLACRVYVRHAEDIPTIAREIEDAWGPGIEASFVRADICRADLLLEIEATADPHASLRPT